MGRARVVIASVLLAALPSAAALAQPDGPPSSTGDADAQLEVALAHYAAGRFREAAEAFRAAYDARPRPEVLVNVAWAQEQAGELEAAATTLDEYATRYPTAPDRDALARRADELRARVAANAPQTRSASGPDPATTGGRGDAARSLAAGSGAPRPADDPRAHETDPAAPPGSDGRPRPPADAPPPREAADPSSPRPAAWALLAVGAGAAIAAGVTGWVAHERYRTLERDCPGDVCPAPLERDASVGRTWAVVSTVATGVAVVSVGLGLWLTLRRAPPDDPSRLRVELRGAPGGAAAAMAWSF